MSLSVMAACAQAPTSDSVTDSRSSTQSAVPTALTWSACADGGVECSTVDVPVDRGDADGPQIGIAVARLRAADAQDRRGTLIVHAGGPAESLSLLTDPRRRAGLAELSQWFDVVTFDSRGYGKSGAVCDPRRAPPINLLDAAEDRAAHAEAQRRYAESCAADNEPLTRHADSVAVADDIDDIRVALGESEIAFFGNSYATVFAQAYAARHGEHLSALYLDSVVDHSRVDAVSPALASDALLTRFRDRCQELPDCAPQGEDVLALWDSMVAAAPVPVASQEPLSQAEIRSASPVLAELAPVPFAAAVRSAHEGDGRALATMIRAARDAPAVDAGQLTNCADFPAPDAAELKRAAKAAPRSGSARVLETWRCGGWPLPVTNPPAEVSMTHAPPALLVNSTLDPATHLTGAQRVRDRIPGSRLLDVTGLTHAVYLGQLDNRCVRDAVHRYLLDGVLPEAGATCEAQTLAARPSEAPIPTE